MLKRRERRAPFRFPPSLIVGAVFFLACAAVVSADTIYLVSGEKVIGKVKKDEPTKVVIESVALGRLEIPRDRIALVELDPAPAATPTSPSTNRPFVPPPPATPPQLASSPTNPPPFASSTNAPTKRHRTSQAKQLANDPSADWIQLKSGEWLRGRLYGMQNRELEFESDELDDLKFDWKDVHQVVAPRAQVSYGDRQSAAGAVRVDREKVTVTGAEEVTFPRYDLVGIAPGSTHELDFWSGKFNVGLNLRAGNTEQADLVTKIKLERRTPNTHLKLEYVGNYSETDGTQNVNNQRATESLDFFLTRRLFLRIPQSEYYSDPFQNIDNRITAGTGVGYYLIDQPKIEWLMSGGPAWQSIHFDTVQAGDPVQRSTPAFVLQSRFEVQLTKRVDLEFGYQAIVANEDSGGLTQHGSATLEIDLTRRLDLDISLIWDRIGNPQTDSSGVTPKKDDLRLDLSFGVKF